MVKILCPNSEWGKGCVGNKTLYIGTWAELDYIYKEGLRKGRTLPLYPRIPLCHQKLLSLGEGYVIALHKHRNFIFSFYFPQSLLSQT